MVRPGLEGCGGFLWCALLGAALAGCGSARSGALGTRGISDGVAGTSECESSLEFVPLGSLPEFADVRLVALDPNSQRASWSYISGQKASSFRWSNEHGISELPVDTLGALWKPVTVPSLQVTQSSADGSVAVGVDITAQGSAGFRWPEDGDAAQLDFVPSVVNRDGTVIVGTQGASELFRWTPAGGVEAPAISYAAGQGGLLSAAGDVMVTTGLDGHCHRWTESTGDQDLGLLASMETCTPSLISESGDVVVGIMQPLPPSPGQIFRWTAAQGLQDLQVGDGSTVSVWPSAMNADGSVIAAQLSARDGTSSLVRWTETTGAQQVATGTDAFASSFTPRGDALVGSFGASLVKQIGTEGYAEAFRWTEAEGVQRLGFSVVGEALGGKLLVGIGPTAPVIRKFGDLGAGAQLVDQLPASIVPEGWSDPLLRGISEDGGLLFGDAQDPDGDRQFWLQHLRESCP